ncbi:hypothetical protein [Micromonospora chalcea]
MGAGRQLLDGIAESDVRAAQEGQGLRRSDSEGQRPTLDLHG